MLDIANQERCYYQGASNRLDSTSEGRVSLIPNPRDSDLGFTGDMPCVFQRVRVRWTPRTSELSRWTRVHNQQAPPVVRNVAAAQYNHYGFEANFD